MFNKQSLDLDFCHLLNYFHVNIVYDFSRDKFNINLTHLRYIPIYIRWGSAYIFENDKNNMYAIYYVFIHYILYYKYSFQNIWAHINSKIIQLIYIIMFFVSIEYI